MGCVQALNPFLSTESAAALVSGAQCWQQLCILEDKLQRCLLCCLGKDAGAADACLDRSPQRLAEDLQNDTSALWGSADHPQWLAWQVLQRLEIREHQAKVALKLLSNVRAMRGNSDVLGSIMQLNMGEGKTRVILPILAMALRGEKELTRGNFPGALLAEAVTAFRSTLTRAPPDAGSLKAIAISLNRRSTFALA